MSDRPLQPFGHDASPYERPTESYRCGHADEGRSCPLGPTRSGRCQAVGECAPRLQGERWHCTRPSARGGPCVQGPSPHGACSHPIETCVPVPTLRTQRRRFVLWCATVTLGLLLIALGGPWRRELASPGPLASPHGDLAARCSACHLPVSAVRHKTAERSAGCLECHAALGRAPRSPHGHPVEELAQITSRLSRGVIKSSEGQREQDCAACHHEHRGAQAQLTRFADRDCQGCHVEKFETFQNHPPFGSFPEARRQRLVFDHAAHLARFSEDPDGKRLLRAAADGALGLNCGACHRAERGGRMLPIDGFAASCTACHHHAQQIRGAAGEGIPFFRLPGIDIATLDNSGLSIGEWPKGARGPGWDGALTPFMQLLMSRDQSFRKARAVLDRAAARQVFLFDLYGATLEEKRAAQQIGWAVKQLLADLVRDRDAALARYLPASSVPRGEGWLHALSGALPLDAPRAEIQDLYFELEALQREQLPHSNDELARHAAGEVIAGETHAAVAAVPAAAAPAASTAGLDDLLGGDTPAPPPAPEPSASAGLDDLLGGDAPPAAPTPKPDEQERQALAAAEARAAAAEARIEKLSGALLQSPGWAARELDFSIRYRPIGHADPFLRAWLDLTGEKGQPLFQSLSDVKSGPGLCTRCHSVDAQGGGFVVQWRGRRSETADRALTFFEHGPHLLAAKGDCTHCHVAPQSPRGARFVDHYYDESGLKTAIAAGVGQFGPIRRELCFECHKPHGAPDGCLTCHRYHERLSATIASAATR